MRGIISALVMIGAIFMAPHALAQSAEETLAFILFGPHYENMCDTQAKEKEGCKTIINTNYIEVQFRKIKIQISPDRCNFSITRTIGDSNLVDNVKISKITEIKSDIPEKLSGSIRWSVAIALYGTGASTRNGSQGDGIVIPIYGSEGEDALDMHKHVGRIRKALAFYHSNYCKGIPY